LRNSILSLLLTVISRLLLYRDRLNGTLKWVTERVPADLERWVVPSGDRRLAGVYCSAGDSASVLLICHGIGELVEYWGGVQALLREMGVSSLVFNYSGYGESSGSVSRVHCEEDAMAAYRMLSTRVDQPIFLLGFSLGTGVASAVAGHLPVRGVILCEGFTTFREAGAAVGVPQGLMVIVPDVWRTIDRVSEIEVPVLVMQSDHDELFPVEMAQRVVTACRQQGKLIVVADLEHNAPIFEPTKDYWQPVVDWMRQKLVAPGAGSSETSTELINPH
jgi:uncharacterized protein